jgi:hypothetical protein
MLKVGVGVVVGSEHGQCSWLNVTVPEFNPISEMYVWSGQCRPSLFPNSRREHS